mgnify:CR=1 FL=1
MYTMKLPLLPQGNTSSEKSDGKKKGVFGSALELISSLFTPLIDVLIGAGILKGLLSILTATNLLTDASGTYQILNAAADSLYYFLPIVIAITCSKKLKTNMFVSVTIAGALLYPNLTTLYDAGTAITFLGIPVHLTAFKSSVFPIIFAIVLLSFVEKGLKKILPDSIRSRIAPFFSLLIVVPVTIVIFGPLGSMLSDTIANFYMSLYKFNPTIAGGFIGAIAQVLVIFGIHWGLFPIIFSNIEKFGFDTILAVFGPSIIAQSGAAFGVWLKTKDKRLKQIASPAAIMGFFGISEPAIYGITLKYRKAFACAVIGGGIGGAIAGSCGARAMAVAVRVKEGKEGWEAGSGTRMKLFFTDGTSVTQDKYTDTYFVGFNDSMIPESERYDAKGTVTPVASSIENNGAIAMKFYSPADGNVVPLTEVSDQAFSSEALGKGIAVKPTNGTIVSPIAGTVSAVYPTAHAYGIKGNNNEEILVHIGIDTVNLNGKYFKSHVSEGDKVKKGKLLVEFDMDAIKKEGYNLITPVVVTNISDYIKAVCMEKEDAAVNAGDKFLTIV